MFVAIRVVVILSLAASYWPAEFRGWSPLLYRIMAAVTALVPFGRA